MASIAHLLRPDIAALEEYTPIVPLDVLATRLNLPIERIIKLDANENPYGPSPGALAAISGGHGGPALQYGVPSVAAPPAPAAAPSASPPAASGLAAAYAIYPDPESRVLREALSAYTGQPVTRIICGAGSDELIDILMRLFLQPGDAIIDCPPTFGMYSFDAGVQAARVVNVLRDETFAVDVEEIAEAAEASGAKMVFLASPNNPSGNLMHRADIKRLLELPLLVIIDEAYAEFSGESVVDLVGQYENLVVLRTFSKWAGLAGLRVGYGLVHESIAEHMWKIKQPYNVNVAAQLAALASLEDLDYLRANVARIVAERERVLAALRALPWLHAYDSEANFILCRVLDGNALAIKQSLERQGILIRHYSKPVLRDCIRLSIGTPGQNNTLLATLRKEHA